MIEKARIKYLNDKNIKKENDYVLYWMQASQREEYNPALEYAIKRSNELSKPLIVYFGITDNYPDANLRHYAFMIDGLKEVKDALKKRKIKMIINHANPDIGAIEMSKKAVLMITDRGYLKIERKWRKSVAMQINIPLVQIESNVIVPIEEVSNKEEYSAATIRNKIKRLLDYYTINFYKEELEKSSLDLRLCIKEFDLNNIDELKIDKFVRKSLYYIGGISKANNHLDEFIKNKLNYYETLHNDPSLDYQSNLSPYLHFGQISPLYIYKKIKDLPNNEKFLEELVIRRELSFNFVFFNEKYDDYEGLPNWVKETLSKHENDKRVYIYDLETFEKYKTQDIYWNAAQKEMVITGKMHGYMRMYWGKKIIEWSKNAKEAFKLMIYLNNKYSIDGRDPSSYAGIAWCFGKHDRPWQERNIFGMIRYMNSDGLNRKFKMEEYVEKINKLGKELDNEQK